MGTKGTRPGPIPLLPHGQVIKPASQAVLVINCKSTRHPMPCRPCVEAGITPYPPNCSHNDL